MFDETKTKGFPFKFQLGGGRIIEGLERGVRGMCKGESRALLVPPELGFDVDPICRMRFTNDHIQVQWQRCS